MPALIALAESSLSSLEATFSAIIPNLLLALIVLGVVFVFYKIITFFIRHWLKHAVRKEHDARMFLTLWKYGFIFLAIILAVIGFSGSLTALGLSVGFFSLVLGWALQKPITGVAAWLAIVIKRPFRVGDRIVINGIRGDVVDINPFYIVLNESGGFVSGEENTGRTILFPSSVLFDQSIINYALDDHYVMTEVISAVTYESNIMKARKECEEAAVEATKEFVNEVEKKPFTRISFKNSGIDVSVRFFVPFHQKEKLATEITQSIYDRFAESNDLEFAYPHTEFVVRGKKGLFRNKKGAGRV